MLSTVLSGPAMASTADGDPQASASEHVVADASSRTRGEQMRFRRGLGLDASDEALARAANADNYAEREFGVPLTDDELSELLR